MTTMQEQTTIQVERKTKFRHRPQNHENLLYDKGDILKSLMRRQIA